MSSTLDITSLPLDGKRVLVRVDFNVPLDESGRITDDTRIKATLPTIEYLLAKKARVILMSHLGRPKGKKEPAFSLAPCAKRLEELIQVKVTMAPDCIGPEVETLVNNLPQGQILLLENLRFYEAEEKPEKDPQFAKQLSHLADFYINDAFGTAHRAHSSTTQIAQFFEGRAAPGFLLEKEITFLGTHFDQPRHPFFAIIGGAKVSSKLKVLIRLLDKVDALFLGGGMAYTFLKAQGTAIGNSLCEEELLSAANDFLAEAKKRKKEIYLPCDIRIADHFGEEAKQRVVSTEEGIPAGWEGMDIGPKTIGLWTALLQKGNMIFWNGPVGVFELAPFSKGTTAIAETLAHMPKAITIAGGGDSTAAINQLGLSSFFTHISTGGGASLEYIELGTLPGIQAISKKD